MAKGLRLLKAIALDEGRTSLTGVAAASDIPLATAHRLALSLQNEGFIVPIRKGHYRLGPALQGIGIGAMDRESAAAAFFRAPLARLARRYRAFGHFGTLEDGMVTYLIKENGTDSELWTKERSQQEAYCSAIGKSLLASLPGDQIENYLADGPFVALTPHTITGADELRFELETVRKQGFALDRNEIRKDLFCVGVPVFDAAERIVGGLSVSFLLGSLDRETIRRVARSLKRIARAYRCTTEVGDAKEPVEDM
ncbi:IclR family transcriptional regulator [Novosphingobium malaysiense]|uniref:IclR family transcriptional regulator n=1 Tax=Novosphingobium malaysiense TaxID=1348853 RepID=UPI001E4CD7FD|nr:IclR family transcriptional regulator [Novosphingobium malaysiense]